MSWLCICGITNAAANTYCAADRTPNFAKEHRQITPSTYDLSLYWTAEGRVNKLLMTENEDLHRKWYNEGAMEVANLDDAGVENYIQELELVAREAKAKILSGVEERRNRKAKSGSKGEWQIAPTGPDVTVTDSINKVKQRGSRISKLDKMKDKLAALGISDNEIDQMIAKMVAQARKDKPSANVIDTGIISDAEREAAKTEKARLKEQDKNELAELLGNPPLPSSEKPYLKLVHGDTVLDVNNLEFDKAKVEASNQPTKTDTFDVSKLKFT